MSERWRRAVLWAGRVFVLTLIALWLLVGLDAWATRTDPVVWGSFTRTSQPCSGRWCVIDGTWRSDDGTIMRQVSLDGDLSDDGTTRAAYQGGLPVPQDPGFVHTAEQLGPDYALPVLGLVITLLAFGEILVPDRRPWWLRGRRGARPASYWMT